MIARFTGGLQTNLREKVKLQRFQWLSEAIAYEETIEEMIESRLKFIRKGLWKNSTSKNTSAPQGTNKEIMAENDKYPEKKEE